MKRKLLSCMLAVMLAACMCACGTGAEGKDAAETANKSLDSVNYTIEREDVSVKDADGNYILKAFYDRVVVNEEGEVAQKINAVLKEDADAFMARAREVAAATHDKPFYITMYKHYSEAEVVTNATGILSIRMTQNQFSGEAHDVDTIFGMNFNLKTGERLIVTELFSGEEAETVQYLRDVTQSYADASGDWSLAEGTRALIDGYNAQNMDFFVQGDTLYLCYAPEGLTSSRAIGTVIVPCPLQTIKVMLDGEYIYFDQQPIMQNDRVLVPMRAIFEAMGYTVTWDQATQTAYADHGTRSLAVTVGNPVIAKAYGTYTCDVAPVNLSGRVLVPVRAISELSGYNVDWDQENLTVVITDPMS